MYATLKKEKKKRAAGILFYFIFYFSLRHKTETVNRRRH
jgi:hypothetical protein